MDTFSVKTKILIGKQDISKILSDIKRVFIVTDKFMKQSIEYITSDLKNVEYEIFDEVVPDPDISIITLGVEKINKFAPDIVIAFGGGSPIDAAKAIVYFAKKTSSIKNLPFVAIPTTSGTGSEVTRFSVISDKEKGIKYPLIDDSLLPDIAILDSELIKSVPPAITADTGIDVITHSIEGFVSTIANDFTDVIALGAFKLAFENLKLAYDKPNDTLARTKMHNASCLAGMSFDNASLGINHGMAHILGARFKLPHGRANAILLPFVIEFNAGITSDRISPLNECASKYAKLAHDVGLGASSDRQSIINLVRAIRRLTSSMKIPGTLVEAGVDKIEFYNQIDEMSQIAVDDRCTATNPVLCTKENIKQLFEKVYKG